MFAIRFPLLVIVLALAFPAASQAQSVLEPGDIVKVRIPPANKAKNMPVSREGTIDLGGYGHFDVAGKSVPEAQDELRAYLSKFIRNTANVTLQLHKPGRLVLITGVVKKPGMVTVGKDDDLWRAISLAGGPDSGADLTRVVVASRQPDGTIEEGIYNVAAYLSGSASVELPIIGRGDTVFVPAGAGLNQPNPGAGFLSDEALSNKVFVLGAVARPGMYDRPQELSALQALALAGGPTADADLGNVRVTTEQGVDRLNVADWLSGQADVPPQIPARGGAIVYVPAGSRERGGGGSLSQSVNVIGGVAQPGRIVVPGATTLIDVISMAGGANQDGDIDDVRVVYRGERYTLATAYSLEDYVEEGGLISQVELRPGDSVYVDQDLSMKIFADTVSVISNLASLATAFALFATLVQQ